MATAVREKPILYDEMIGATGLSILYTPSERGVALEARGGSSARVEFSSDKIDEAHILYMEATELLRSRAKINQDKDDVRRAVEVLFAQFRGENVSAERIVAASAPRTASPTAAPVNKPIDVD